MFVPNDPNLFVALTMDGLELRQLSNPNVTDQLISETSIISGRWFWLMAGSALLYGSTPDYDSPMEWMMIDATTWEAKALPDLTGLKPIWPRLAAPHPEYVLFVVDTWDETSGPVIGLDVACAETWVVHEDAVVSSFEGITASADGRIQTVTTNEPIPNVLMVDMETRSVVEYEAEDRMIPINAAVNPDGTILTIQYLNVRSDEQMLFWALIASPEERVQLTESVLLGWC